MYPGGHGHSHGPSPAEKKDTPKGDNKGELKKTDSAVRKRKKSDNKDEKEKEQTEESTSTEGLRNCSPKFVERLHDDSRVAKQTLLDQFTNLI